MHPLADTGRVIAGRYRLQAPIGRGAMGVVWRAHDQLLDREVAVKEVQIAETLTDAERANAYQRTLREAKTAARLNHPAVVTVYDVCQDEGRPWIVMQLVSAQSLDQVLAASGPLSPRRAAEMARQLLSALSVAHAAGVMHRDVKPSNVLLGSDDRAVLTDFGIATFQGDSKLTQTGMVMGSPGFTAPERIRGEDASAASDLWSLGATLFAAVEGHGPFEQRGGAITTMSAIINEDAPDAPDAGALGPVIAALLRREPADRPDASAAARMITDVLPLLPDRTPAAPAGYEATVLSASSRPASPGLDGLSPDRFRLGCLSRARSRWTSPRPSRRSRRSRRPPARTRSWRPGVGRADRPDHAAAGSGGRRLPAAAGQQLGAGRGRRVLIRGRRVRGPAGGTAARFLVLVRPGSPDRSDRRAGLRLGLVRIRIVGVPARLRRGVPAPARAVVGLGARPASRPAPWSGAGYEPPRRQRSGAGWKIAIAVLAIIGAGAGAATVVLLHQNHSDSPQSGGTTATGSASGSSAATLPSAKNAPQIVDAINEPATGPLPSGFTTISQPAAANETAGFSLAAPTSWKESTSGYQTYLKDPAEPNTNILIDLTPHTYPNDMLREAKYIEARSIPDFPGYQRVGLAALNIRGTPGSYWKFTWTDAGVEQEAIDLLFVMQTSAGPQSYALYMTAPEKLRSDTADLRRRGGDLRHAAQLH